MPLKLNPSDKLELVIEHYIKSNYWEGMPKDSELRLREQAREFLTNMQQVAPKEFELEYQSVVPANIRQGRDPFGRFQSLREDTLGSKKLIEELRDSIKNLGRPKIKDKSNVSEWFRKKLTMLVDPKTYKGRTPTTLLDPSRFRPEAVVGRMFIYNYHPKLFKTLKYYDTFPCVFPIELYPDGFLGINLHYLDPITRYSLFTKLLQLKNGRMSKETTLKLSYMTLKGMAKYKEYEPCLKRYLYSHLRSGLMEVETQDWITVLHLPFERFKKATAAKVWAESKERIAGNPSRPPWSRRGRNSQDPSKGKK